MKTNFLNSPLYRILTPSLVSGLVYLLMLLVFDKLSEIDNNFSPEEFIFLMVVTFLLFESYRFWIKKTEKLKWFEGKGIIKTIVLYSGSLLITFAVVIACFSLYFVYIIGLSEFRTELTSFIIVFTLVGILFHLFYLSIQFLDRQNTLLLQKEEMNRKNIEFELEVFKNKLNPDFLYESFESVISLIRKNDVENAEKYIDHLALFYRRILGNRYSEIISLEEEKLKVKQYLKIRNYKYSNNFIVNWNLNSNEDEIHVVPNMILQTIQLIEYCQMIDSHTKLSVDIKKNESYIIFEFLSSEKLTPKPKVELLKESIQKAISFYSDLDMKWECTDNMTRIFVPTIKIED